MPLPVDPTSIAGKAFPVEEHVPLLVLGAGPAGLAAAIEAARCGLHVVLIDEHPVASALIGLDVPFVFGDRLDPAVQNKPRMTERVVAARPDLEQAIESGVDVRLGVYAWGAFVTGATSRALPHPLLGLADEERSWLVSFDRMIVAAGARDLALAFPGWDRPGVMGARGADTAIRLYQAFAGRRLVVLGAGALGLGVARAAQEAGLEVAAIVDVGAQAAADAAALRTRGIPIHTEHAIRATLGTAEVEGVRIAPLADPERSARHGLRHDRLCGRPGAQYRDVRPAGLQHRLASGIRRLRAAGRCRRPDLGSLHLCGGRLRRSHRRRDRRSSPGC